MQALLQMNQMTEATLQEITDFALEEAVRLTRSAIGYLAFLNDDESVLTMHAWSKSAMAECAIADKPINYPVETTGLWGEAVRQRRPVITNGYTATDPLMKGYPEGHVTVRRHMNTPVFVGSKIVLVAGVGNKTEAYDQGDVQQLTLLMEGMWRLIERKRAEEALRESEKKYRLIAENTADLISILDMNLKFTYVSPASMRLRGFTIEEAMEQSIEQVLTPESLRIALSVFEEEMLLEASGTADPDRIRILELEEYKKDGSIVWVEVSLSFLRDQDLKPVQILIVSRDITDRKKAAQEKAKLEDQLLQAMKFEAIGTLAGGIAHDFNNLLMGIQGRASLLSLDLGTSNSHWEHINAIEEYVRSATSLTRQLLGFARGGKYEVKPIDLNELVLNSSAMFGRTKKEIQIHTNCQASALVVEADRGQIEQVLLNMYVNAWQAMHHNEGHLYLETKIVTLDEVSCKPHQIKPGRYVKISITDTGTGMDEVTRLRIFDPFFTTKEMGRGTGLGLASAYGIIKNHGGMIAVYSEIGHGTTFNIYLPVSDKEAHREVPLEGGLIKGSATILLVDDEELIIDVGQAMLERLGYRVVVGREGREAVTVITHMGDEIDLVILDMIMPGMDGGTTFDRIREIRPDIPVILSSGYAINGHADKIMRRGCNGFIQKPYNISELSQQIRKVLDEANCSTSD
jgi:PAS domain S-box-containing protein